MWFQINSWIVWWKLIWSEFWKIVISLRKKIKEQFFYHLSQDILLIKRKNFIPSNFFLISNKTIQWEFIFQCNENSVCPNFEVIFYHVEQFLWMEERCTSFRGLIDFLTFFFVPGPHLYRILRNFNLVHVRINLFPLLIRHFLLPNVFKS